MRPTLSWSDLPGRRVGLYGLGREGGASLRACRARGVEPVLVDDRPAGPVDGAPVLATGSGGLDALLSCDVVVKSPGISRYGGPVRALEAAGVAVTGGLALWLAGADRSRVLCVTGTKGKSTTCAIAGHLLAGWGRRALVVGNIGVPPFDPALEGADGVEIWVVEVSSYQASDLAVTPPVTVVTSLHPDHLPWHAGDPERYFADKLSMCSQPGADLTVADGDSPLLRERRALLGPRVEWVRAADAADAAWPDALGLPGAHNRRNALLAAAALAAMGVPEAGDASALQRAAAGFGGLESRLRTVREADGVAFVDDSLSTNVLPTLAAVDAFPGRRIALLVGGEDRGIDYAPLADGLRDRGREVLVLTLPDSGPRIAATLDAVGTGPTVEVRHSADLAAAVRDGFAWARPGGVVLLSPAAPSFGRFRDYRDRAAAFVRAADDVSGTVSGVATGIPA